jgi:fructokinase
LYLDVGSQIRALKCAGWGHTDVLGGLGIRSFGKPFKFDTDVNAPALAEFLKQKERLGISSCAYITVGTGIGVGLVCNGQTVHGLMHPEAGHICTAKKEGDTYLGRCPYHTGCIEGLCASRAIAERKGCDISDLPGVPDDDEVWYASITLYNTMLILNFSAYSTRNICAFYLAQLCVNLILISSPEKIVLGGGLMNRASLYPKIRDHVQTSLNGYICVDSILTAQIDDYISASFWGANAGIVGALHLALFSLPAPQASLTLPHPPVAAAAPPPAPPAAPALARAPNRNASSWDEAVNMLVDDARAMILRDRPDVQIAVVPDGAMVTMDHRMDRVRIYSNHQGRVARAPRLG